MTCKAKKKFLGNDFNTKPSVIYKQFKQERNTESI